MKTSKRAEELIAQVLNTAVEELYALESENKLLRDKRTREYLEARESLDTYIAELEASNGQGV